MPPTWAKFKIFLQKNLAKNRIFVDDIWRKMCNVNQYQLEDVMDRLAHTEQLLFFLKEFDNIVAPINNLLIGYFWDSMRLFIWSQLDK